MPDTTIRLELTTDEVRATAGCNHLFGTLESSDDGILEVSEMGGTEMGCPPELHAQDEWLAELLTSGPSWSLDGDELILSSGEVEVVMVDREEADPDRALEGTTWIVDTLFSGSGPDGAATNPPPGAEAQLRFEDGRVSGSTGCNELSGTYEIEDGSIILDDLVQTYVLCGEELMELETAVTSLAGGPLQHEIEAGRLRLTTPSGEGLGLHAGDS